MNRLNSEWLGMQLVIFDCDGTLVDSQHLINTAMTHAFAGNGLDAPPIERVRAVVGLSLPHAIESLIPEASPELVENLCATYRQAHFELRMSRDDQEPLFDGMESLVRRLSEQDDLLLGVATGKSRRGLTGFLERHDLKHLFSTLQTADDAPSKPDPAMINQAMNETGVPNSSTIMIGDTSFDMMMAKGAGVRALGVAWGYHPVSVLQEAGADHIANSSEDLEAVLINGVDKDTET